jgi:hypothetical protein
MTKGSIKQKSAMESLIADFTEHALERSKQMGDEEFERTVKESHEIIDRGVSPSRRCESA